MLLFVRETLSVLSVESTSCRKFFLPVISPHSCGVDSFWWHLVFPSVLDPYRPDMQASPGMEDSPDTRAFPGTEAFFGLQTSL